MAQQEKHIQDLSQIKTMMERSSRFISLSGLSGVSAGIIALIGAAIAFFYLEYDTRYFNINLYFINKRDILFHGSILFIFIDALVVLILALSAGIFFTLKKAKRKNIPFWDSTAKRLVFNTSIPLVVGGIFCIILLYHGLIFLVAPTTLIFYGLALFTGGNFTLSEIKYLGISEMILGLLGLNFLGYGLIFWSLGFGVLHIVYGIAMYFKYER